MGIGGSVRFLSGLPLLLLGCLTPAEPEPLPDRSFGEVVELTSHGNPAVRMEAAGELGRRGGAEAFEPLVGLLADGEPAVRAQATEALRRLRDPRTVPVLSGILGDPDPTVRCRAALALGSFGRREAVPALTGLLSDPGTAVRAAAVRGLGEIGDPAALPSILDALRAEPPGGDDPVAACALVAAARLGGVRGLSQSLALVGDRLPVNWLLRASAAHAIGLAGDTSRAGLLAEWLDRDEDPRVYQAAATALATLGERERLAEVLSHRQNARRKAATSALAGLPGDAATADLRRAARDPDQAVVLEAAAGLLARGETDAFPLVISLLGAGESAVWLGALDVLVRLTGLDIGRDPALWSEWFTRRRANLSFDAAAGVYRGVE